MHDAVNRVRLSLNQQVNVIGHQAIRVKKVRQLVFLNFQQRKKLLIVIIAMENRLPIISSGDEVIETAF